VRENVKTFFLESQNIKIGRQRAVGCCLWLVIAYAYSAPYLLAILLLYHHFDKMKANGVSGSCHSSLLICYLLLISAHSCLARRAEQQDEQMERRGPDAEQARERTLADVWLCLACSLGWTVWMVAAHMRPAVEQYATEATVVYGNVLQSSVIIGDGIPIHRAVIDYVLHDIEETQVRKEFTTDEKLEEGFANVEILVLPTDPTSGVLKKDWEVEYKEFLEHNASHKRGSMLSLVLAAVLVTISLAGAVMTVLRLPIDKITWGWISIVTGVALLWPVAILLYANGRLLSNMATLSRHEKGVVIRGEQPPLKFSLNPCVSMDGSEGMSISAPDALRKAEPKTTKPPAIELFRIPTGNGKVIMPPHLRIRLNDVSLEEEPHQSSFGCYFINLPFRTTRTSSPKTQHSGVSSMSSVSSASASPINAHQPPYMNNSTKHIV
jgi:hypothetical protein